MAKDPVNGAVPSPQVPSEPTDEAGAADPLYGGQSQIAPRILSGLAILSFLAAIVLLVIGIFNSDLIDNVTSRMSLIMFTSLTLSTFMWALFPHQVVAEPIVIPVLNWKVSRLAGPFLMFFIALGVLHFVYPYPRPPATRFFSITVSNNGPTPPLSSFSFDGQPTHRRLWAVVDRSQPGDGLTGFIARFDSNEPFTVRLMSPAGFFEEKTVTFEPGTNNGSFNLTLVD